MSTTLLEQPALKAAITGPIPPVPTITSINQAPPAESPRLVLSTSGDRLALYADSDNSSRNAWVADTPGQALGRSAAVLRNYWGDGPARAYTLTLRRFWKQVDGAFTIVGPGSTYQKEYTVTHGVSVEDSQTLSAELGVEVGGLSAKITASFTHSVTTSDETSEQTTYTVAGVDGKQRAWALYQLVDELVALDGNGNVISGSGLPEGDVSWFEGADFPFKIVSGAFLSYKTVQQTFPSQTFVASQADFPL